MLYGRNRSVGSVTTAEDFDFSVISDPFVVLDNVDTWEKWLPDRLALSASTSDVTRRQLYKNADVIKLKRQAMVGITAHNPKFGREDVADRFILLNFERLKDENRKNETEIINNIIENRNKLWGAIAKDLQKILSCANIDYENAPSFRIEDFAHIGYRISKGLEISESFKVAIKNISRKQKEFNLDEEHILVTALQTLVTRKPSDEFKTSDTLCQELENCCSDPLTFRRLYGNIKLGKKLWSLHDSLKTVFDIEWKSDPIRASRTWRIRCLKN